MNLDSDFAIETSGLIKVLGGTRAVDGIDLEVPRGTVYSLLGPNGAGKTTMIRILSTLLRPDGGSARVVGFDVVRQPDEVRNRVSLTGQFASVDDDLTAFENLELVSRLLGHSRTAAKARTRDLIAAFGLADAAGRLVKTFSGGMRRRLDIAASIIVTPELLFLDEPTTGLDPHSRNQVWEIVRTIVAAGTTVMLTTQNLDEADQLADRLAVIDHGRLIAEGTSGELKASIGSGILRVRLREPERRTDAKRLLSQMLCVPVQLESDSSELSARVTAGPGMPDSGQGVAAALAALSHSGIEVSEFAFGQPSLDEVFLALTESSTSHHTLEVQSA